MTRPFAYLDHPGPIAFAHRGGAAESPENSWAAFEHAVGLGYRYIETDIRATSDGVAVALHDPGLQRVAHHPGLVARTSWQALSSVALDDGRPVPRLEELLGAWGDVHWNIDIKAKAALAPTVDALRRTGAANRVLVTAFSGRRTAQARRALGPDVATGAGRGLITALVLAKKLPLLPLLPLLPASRGPLPAAAQVPLTRRGVPVADEAFVRVCHRAGIAVHVWTVDDEPTISRLLDMGVDGIMTDRPTLLKAVMTARGQWA